VSSLAPQKHPARLVEVLLRPDDARERAQALLAAAPPDAFGPVVAFDSTNSVLVGRELLEFSITTQEPIKLALLTVADKVAADELAHVAEAGRMTSTTVAAVLLDSTGTSAIAGAQALASAVDSPTVLVFLACE
jgi:hypothetical protein